MTYPRPLSPHLQIYKPQLTSILSITHRATGIALALGILPLVHWIWAIGQGEEAYEFAMWLYGNWFGLICLFGWSVCFFYHLANGVRHLFWDAGYGLELKETYLTGQLVVGFTFAATLISWVWGLIKAGWLW